MASSLELMVTIHSLAALDLKTGVEQSFNCLIIQNSQAVGKPMDWALDDDMVDGFFFCDTLKSRRKGHSPFVQNCAHEYITLLACLSSVGYEVLVKGRSWQFSSHTCHLDVNHFIQHNCQIQVTSQYTENHPSSHTYINHNCNQQMQLYTFSHLAYRCKTNGDRIHALCSVASSEYEFKRRK